jgi:hypothetical protein
MGQKNRGENAERLSWIQIDLRKALVFEGVSRQVRVGRPNVPARAEVNLTACGETRGCCVSLRRARKG